jgi:hypothetical protein
VFGRAIPGFRKRTVHASAAASLASGPDGQGQSPVPPGQGAAYVMCS